MLNALVATGTSKSALEVGLEVLGVTAGLTAFAYFIGAVTIWVRLFVAGFPADIGLELASDGRIIAVGVRGIAVVTAVGGLLLLIVNLYGRYVSRRVNELFEKHVRIAYSAVFFGVFLLFYLTIGTSFRVLWTFVALVDVASVSFLLLDEDRETSSWVVALVSAVVALVISAWIGWRLFGLVVALLGIVIAVALASEVASRRVTNWGVRRPTGRLPWWINLIIIGFVALAAVAWQVNAPISIATIHVEPRINPALLDNPPVPYFGSIGDLLYVACVVPKTETANEHDYRYLNPIVELHRDDLTYVEYSQAKRLYPYIKSPREFLWDWVQLVWHSWGRADTHTGSDQPLTPACTST